MSKLTYAIYERIINLLQEIMSNLNTKMKKENRILFYNYELRDNSKYMLKYISEREKNQIICYTNKKILENEKLKNVKYISNVFKLFYYLLTSKIIIQSFDLRFKFKPGLNQMIIQLWHGSPLKTIGNDSTFKEYGKQRARYFTHVICASDFFKNIYVEAFGCYDSQIKILGNPRNDLLFEPLEPQEINNLFNTSFDKVIMWMPTYRQSKILHGIEDSMLEIPIIDKENLPEINEYLTMKNVVIVLKLHPLQNDIKLIDGQYSNIIILKDELLKEKGYELYNLLGYSHALITDYSSVYFDYLLLDRPIAFTIQDITEYNDNRGFTVNNPKELMPGVKLQNAQDLIKFIDSLVLQEDFFINDRARVNDLVNLYRDGKNSERVYKELEKILKS
ncbi:hypothetical protein EVJ27_06930 [Exiguobacterium sp. SH3S2]|uniref:CDP-glycerol glycerophosphotransferase family protein n=1 Tax=unclassified Exiguobacterium TaxID=2644629 RepID=UPI001040A4D4|nr:MULTISPECIES: CDP-glycerol glycerophosphotransferase family protein [unclassified Exiguobacterium]TCI46217.1 hypothetical protein EVJ28_06925 [Exiguobacterium sp. SH3S3]TCI61305.1 hypothetical protein EVJ27_06930 [Exiguobacterium sp. SH3S2]